MPITRRHDHVHDAGAGHVVIKGLAQALNRHAARQIGHRDQSHQSGEHQRSRGQNDGGPEVAGIARNGGEQRRAEGQSQAHQREQEFDPHFRRGRLQPLRQPVRQRRLGTEGFDFNGLAYAEPTSFEPSILRRNGQSGSACGESVRNQSELSSRNRAKRGEGTLRQRRWAVPPAGMEMTHAPRNDPVHCVEPAG